MKYKPDYLLADPCAAATQGLLDADIGIATLGWIISKSYLVPSVVAIPVAPYVEDLTRDWWVRWNDNTPWYGPLTYQEANMHARRMTMDVDNTIPEVKYAQVGTLLGTRPGDPVRPTTSFDAVVDEDNYILADAHSEVTDGVLDMDIGIATIGYIIGTEALAASTPNMLVAYIYANGKQYLAGRMAAYNADKVPP